VVTLLNCGIDGTEFITQFLQFGVGLRELTLIGSNLTMQLPALQKVAVKEFTFLWLQRSRNVSLAFLSSLLELIRVHDIVVSSLDLSELNLPPDDFTQFLKMVIESEHSEMVIER
jgi:hypothetical protein